MGLFCSSALSYHLTPLVFTEQSCLCLLRVWSELQCGGKLSILWNKLRLILFKFCISSLTCFLFVATVKAQSICEFLHIAKHNPQVFRSPFRQSSPTQLPLCSVSAINNPDVNKGIHGLAALRVGTAPYLWTFSGLSTTVKRLKKCKIIFPTLLSPARRKITFSITCLSADNC